MSILVAHVPLTGAGYPASLILRGTGRGCRHILDVKPFAYGLNKRGIRVRHESIL
jgi:hypothetical protein